MAYLEIGTTPVDEDCAQTGSKEYDAFELNKLEVRGYIEALRRKYGKEPEGATLRPKSTEHDFGVYVEAVVHYDPGNVAAREYAFRIEEGLSNWSEVGMWPPVSYDSSSGALKPILILRDPQLWDRKRNPHCYADVSRLEPEPPAETAP